MDDDANAVNARGECLDRPADPKERYDLSRSPWDDAGPMPVVNIKIFSHFHEVVRYSFDFLAVQANVEVIILLKAA